MSSDHQPHSAPSAQVSGEQARGLGWRSGWVRALGSAWTGAQEVQVEVAPGPGRPAGLITALAYPALVGQPEVDDPVLITTGPLDRGLGTGGFALVVALPTRLPEPGPAAGHLVKARYTPLQVMVQGADEQDSPYHDILAEAEDLLGAVVVTADLHSALPAIVAGIRQVAPGASIAYVMTDGGALPAWLSRTVAGLRAAQWITGCVTTGQAFGGDIEAVSLHSGLLAARLVLAAEIIVVSQGPGNLGTGTTWGFSGVAVGEAINAAGVLGGRPVGSVRISQADPRSRHRGISHHSRTAYGRVALCPADLVLPELPGAFGELLEDQAQSLIPAQSPHRLVRVKTEGLLAALGECPVPLRTMGRGLDADPAAFLAAAAAGVHAGTLATGTTLSGS